MQCSNLGVVRAHVYHVRMQQRASLASFPDCATFLGYSPGAPSSCRWSLLGRRCLLMLLLSMCLLPAFELSSLSHAEGQWRVGCC